MTRHEIAVYNGTVVLTLFPFLFLFQFVKLQLIWRLYWTVQVVSEAITSTKSRTLSRMLWTSSTLVHPGHTWLLWHIQHIQGWNLIWKRFTRNHRSRTRLETLDTEGDGLIQRMLWILREGISSVLLKWVEKTRSKSNLVELEKLGFSLDACITIKNVKFLTYARSGLTFVGKIFLVLIFQGGGMLSFFLKCFRHFFCKISDIFSALNSFAPNVFRRLVSLKNMFHFIVPR